MKLRLLAWSSLIVLSTSALVAGSIGGVVFEDENRDGVRDPQERLIANVPIDLVGDDSNVVLSTVTGADGSYRFDGLADDSYLLSIRPSSGARPSLPDATALPAPIPEFPFGSPRYSTMPNLLLNLDAAAQSGSTFEHVGLGDSIGFGFNVCGSIFGEDGYFQPTTERLRRAAAAAIDGDKQSFPGDETADLLDPDVDLLLFFNDIFYAVDEGADLVSISIGGNDFLGNDTDAELAEDLVVARQNIQEIVASLLSELPSADVEFNTVYDNLEGNDALHNTWVPIWMQALREGAWAQARPVTIAEVYPEYRHDEDGVKLGEPGLICNNFLDGIHPTNEGYDVHEEKLWQAFGGVTLAGNDRLDVDLGYVRKRGEVEATTFEQTAGVTVSPEEALAIDGTGALVPSDGAEFRLMGFLPFAPPPGFDLTHAIIKVVFRTTGAPIDDYYAFEASIDGTFSAPGQTPTSWNTIIPLVGSAGNSGAERLGFPDQPQFRVASAPLYLGAPTSNGETTLTWSDLETVTVRVLTTVVGDPDPFSVEWDGAAIEVYARPTTAAAGHPSLARLVVTAPLAARDEILRSLETGAAPRLIDALGDVGTSDDVPLLASLTSAARPMVRAHAVRALARLAGTESAEVLLTASHDSAEAVRRAALRSWPAALPLPPADAARLAGDDDALVRRLAVGRHGASLAGPLLLEMARRDPSASVRLAAAATLLSRGDLSALPEIVEQALDPERRRATQPLIAGRNEASVLLAQRLGDADSAGIAELLGWSGGPAAIAELERLLAAGDAATRALAARSLARLGVRDSASRIAALVPSSPAAERLKAAALAELDVPATYGALAEMARTSASAYTRKVAARGLAAAGDPAARHFLEALLDSPDERVRRLALSGLARLGADEVGGPAPASPVTDG